MIMFPDNFESMNASALSAEERKETRNNLYEVKQKINSVINDIDEIDRKEKMIKRIEYESKFVGKCFKLKKGCKLTSTSFNSFKVLEILPAPNENYAKSIVLFDKDNRTVWNSKGIKITALPIFSYDSNKLMPTKDCETIIGKCEEIDEEEFKTMVNQFYDGVLKEVDKK